MFYPQQIPYLLDQEFQSYIDYTEHHPAELDDFCMCIWEMKSRKTADIAISNNILPDACIDIVIDFANRIIRFAGFSKETEKLPLDKRIDFMGVRMKPGTFYALFDIPAHRIMDRETFFHDIEPATDLDKILDLQTSSERIECLKSYLLQKLHQKSTTPLMRIVDELYDDPKSQNVAAIARKLNCGERQLYRIFKTNFGISPKILLNILRLHLCLTLILEKDMSPVSIANLCGFYDQSHFIKEIKRYTGVSPLKIVEDYQ